MKKVQPLTKYPCPTDHVMYSELIGIVVGLRAGGVILAVEACSMFWFREPQMICWNSPVAAVSPTGYPDTVASGQVFCREVLLSGCRFVVSWPLKYRLTGGRRCANLGTQWMAALLSPVESGQFCNERKLESTQFSQNCGLGWGGGYYGAGYKNAGPGGCIRQEAAKRMSASSIHFMESPLRVTRETT